MLIISDKKPAKDGLTVDVGSYKSDIEQGEVTELTADLPRGLTGRHLQFIALCGSIGTALFVGSGIALTTCGPAALLTSFCITSVGVFFVMNYLAEMACWMPTPGLGPATFVTKYCEPSLGFATSVMYIYLYGILVPIENIAAVFILQYWVTPEQVPTSAWIAILFVVMLGINLTAVKFYGESEFLFGCLKLTCIMGLIICGFVIFLGGAPDGDRRGFRYWNDPGSFALHQVPDQENTARFLDVWTAIVRSAFAFILGPELIITAGGECQRPRHNIAKASRRFIYRLVIFYIIGVFIITVTVPYNDPSLIGAINDGDSGARASPFVVGIQNAGIPVLNHIVNAVIFSSALSAGNSFLFAGSRALINLARDGSAPKIFLKTNRFGVPYYSVLAVGSLGLLAFLNVDSDAAQAFTWLSNLVTIGGFICWIFTGFAYLRWRKAIAYNGLEDQVPYKSPFQPYGAYFAIIFFGVVTITNGYDVFFNFNGPDFVAAYITIPVFLVLYIGNKIWRKTPWLLKVEDIDVTTGLDEIEFEEEIPPPPTLHGKFFHWLF